MASNMNANNTTQPKSCSQGQQPQQFNEQANAVHPKARNDGKRTEVIINTFTQTSLTTRRESPTPTQVLEPSASFTSITECDWSKWTADELLRLCDTSILRLSLLKPTSDIIRWKGYFRAHKRGIKIAQIQESKAGRKFIPHEEGKRLFYDDVCSLTKYLNTGAKRRESLISNIKTHLVEIRARLPSGPEASAFRKMLLQLERNLSSLDIECTEESLAVVSHIMNQIQAMQFVERLTD